MAAPKSVPKDAQVMASILKDMGIIEYEPRVVNQMLEFTYRYITNILDDARVFSTHAKKKNVDIDDVKLAIQMQMDKSFTTPPPRDILIDIARQRNNMPLPLIKPHCGPRLPPDRYCLSSCNFRLKSTKKQHCQIKALPAVPQLISSKINSPRQLGSSFIGTTGSKISSGSKVSPAVNLATKSGATLSLVGKGTGAPTVTIVTRGSTGTTSSSTATTIKQESGSIPSPIIKLTSGSTIGALGSTGSLTVAAKAPSIITRTIVAPCKPSPDSITADTSLKRKREDDDYDAE